MCAGPAADPPAPLRVGVDVRALASPFLRGFGRYTLELVRALARSSGLQLTAFTDAEPLHEVPFPVVRFAASREIVREQLVLPRLIKRHGIDVFLCPANRGLPFAAPCPTVLTLHDAVEWDRSLVAKPRGRSRLRFAYASAASLASASLIITVSRSSARAIESILGVPESRIRIVHEAADPRFSAHADPNDERTRHALGLARPYLLYVGGFDRKKDVETVVRAFSLVHTRTHLDLVLAGRVTDEAEPIARMCDALGLAERVRFPGYVPDDALPGLYRGSRCFVFPAVAEGFGLPVVEAMSCGVPVIAAAAGSLPEVVGAGGQLFEAGDQDALASILSGLLMDDERERWANAALGRAAAFSWETTAAVTEQVLRDAAADSLARVAVGRVLRLGRAVSRSV